MSKSWNRERLNHLDSSRYHASAAFHPSRRYASVRRFAVTTHQIPKGLDRREAEAYAHLDPKRLPRHIAIIMDGNGRWARKRHLPRIAGHRAGVNSVRSTVETAARIGVPALTLYAFSVENWKRRPRG